MRLVSLLLVAVKATLLLAGAAHGEVCVLRMTNIQCDTARCQRVNAFGSCFTIGTLKDGTTAVLTAAHCVRGVDARSTVAIDWYDGYVPATVIASGEREGLDVALLSAKLPAVGGNYLLRPDGQPDGMAVVVAGYPTGHAYLRLPGRLALTRQFTGNMVCIEGAQARGGQSGGPAIAESRTTVGVVSMSGDGETLIVPSWTIRRWLERTIGYVPEPPSSPLEPTPLEVVPGPPVVPANVIGCGCGRPFCLCRPPRPGASTTPVVPPTTPIVQQPAAESNSAVLAEIAALKAAIAAIPRGEKGERGERGPAGPQGPPGRDGKDGETVIMPAPPATPTADEGFIMAIKPRDPTLSVVESNLHIVRDGDGYKVRVIYPDGRMGDVESIKPGQRVPVKVFEGAK